MRQVVLIPFRWAIRRPGEHALAQSWRRFLVTLAGAFVAVSLLLAATIALVDPYGSGLPTALPLDGPPMNGNQRFTFPAMVRSERFDSYILGMSSSRALDPLALSRVFGGRFAHLGMNGATPWEQRLMGLLAARHWTGGGGTLLWSLDRYWCFKDIGPHGHRESPAPEWLYDENVWNDIPFLFNAKAVDRAMTIIRFHLGLVKPRTRADGFLVETPDERTYDLAEARKRLARDSVGGRAGVGLEPIAPAPALSGRFPALAWMDEVLSALPDGTRKVLVLIPAHITSLPQGGSGLERQVAECKAELAHLALRHRAHLVDFRAATPLTTNDGNFWDGVHFRRHVAPWIIGDIERAVLKGENGRYSLLLARP
jgi:hypothetical protein